MTTGRPEGTARPAVSPAGAGIRTRAVALWRSDIWGRERQPIADPVRRDAWTQVWLVLAVGLGASAVNAVTQLIGALTRGPLKATTAVLHQSASTRQWLDITYQLEGIAFGLAPVALALYLLSRLPRVVPGPPGPAGVVGWAAACRRVGFDLRRPLPDVALGSLLALAIGIPGLLLYLGSYAAGLSVTVNPGNLPAHWWAWVIYVLSAAQNAVLEETIVVGFTVTQLRRAGVAFGPTVLFSAVLRGSYHLYQGFGAFVGNAVMGVIFVLLYRRTRRVMPLVVAHTLIDTVAFIGYALLAGHVWWLPA